MLYEQAKRLRIEKGLTQADVAKHFKKSPAWVSLLENGKVSLDEEREYLRWLEGRRARRQRTPGGDFKVGRLRHPPVKPSAVRGEPLNPAFNHAESLPPGDTWEILAITRTSPSTELAFLFNPKTDAFGMAGFHQIGTTIRRGAIIPFTEQYDDAASTALEAFANSNFDFGESESCESSGESLEQLVHDGGILADDLAASHHAV